MDEMANELNARPGPVPPHAHHSSERRATRAIPTIRSPPSKFWRKARRPSAGTSALAPERDSRTIQARLRHGHVAASRRPDGLPRRRRSLREIGGSQGAAVFGTRTGARSRRLRDHEESLCPTADRTPPPRSRTWLRKCWDSPRAIASICCGAIPISRRRAMNGSAAARSRCKAPPSATPPTNSARILLDARRSCSESGRREAHDSRRRDLIHRRSRKVAPPSPRSRKPTTASSAKPAAASPAVDAADRTKASARASSKSKSTPGPATGASSAPSTRTTPAS